MVSVGQSAPYHSPLNCRKINLPPRPHFCRLFVLFWKKKNRASWSLFSLPSAKEILIRRHCTIHIFICLFIVFCTNDAHHAEGHDLHEDFCRGASLPHHGFKSQEIFWGVWRDWRSGCHHRQTDWEVKGLWICEYHFITHLSLLRTFFNKLFTHVGKALPTQVSVCHNASCHYILTNMKTPTIIMRCLRADNTILPKFVAGFCCNLAPNDLLRFGMRPDMLKKWTDSCGGLRKKRTMMARWYYYWTVFLKRFHHLSEMFTTSVVTLHEKFHPHSW